MQARILGMLSPWFKEASIDLGGDTFEHRSFDLLLDPKRPWLLDALCDVRFEVGR